MAASATTAESVLSQKGEQLTCVLGGGGRLVGNAGGGTAAAAGGAAASRSKTAASSSAAGLAWPWRPRGGFLSCMARWRRLPPPSEGVPAGVRRRRGPASGALTDRHWGYNCFSNRRNKPAAAGGGSDSSKAAHTSCGCRPLCVLATASAVNNNQDRPLACASRAIERPHAGPGTARLAGFRRSSALAADCCAALGLGGHWLLRRRSSHIGRHMMIHEKSPPKWPALGL